MDKKNRVLIICIKAASIFSAFLFAMTSSASDIVVRLNNTEAGKGKVYVALCREENFMKSRCDYEVIKLASENFTTVSFVAVNAGEYAISAFYDLNDNEDLDTSFFGAPKEPVAVSNNATGNNAPPSFSDARIQLVDEEDLEIEIDFF